MIALKEDYRIHTAASKQESMKIFKKTAIPICIIDQKILDKPGDDVLKFISNKFSKTIIILTGVGDNTDTVINAMNSGHVYHYVKKPWDEKGLKDIVDGARAEYTDKQGNAYLIDKMECMIEELKFLHRISQNISEKKSLPRLMKEIMESSKLLMNAEASSLLLYDPEDKKLSFQVATGDMGNLVKKFSVDLGVGIAGWVAKYKKPLLIKDCYKDPRFSPDYDKKTRFHTKSMICVPLIRKRQLLGVIQVINKKGGGEFEDRDLALFETLASQCAIAVENNKLVEIQVESEALERELETARKIQQKLLPSSLPEYEDIQVAAQLIPAKQVGGDYYNIIRIDDNRSLFFVTDVTGKGIPAALIVSTIFSCLDSYIKFYPDRFDLMTLVTTMNRVLIESTTTDKFATSWFGTYLHDSKKLISLNAGHNPPYLFRSGMEEPIELATGGIFLGGYELPYKTEEIELRKNDVLIFYSDGVTEAFNGKEEEYGERRLIKVAFDHVEQSAQCILSEIEKDVKKHVGKAQQSDDFTCAVVKIL